MDAIRPAISERGKERRVRSVVSMAISNLRRVLSRTVLGAAGLFVGVGALTLLLAINRAFEGVLVGTLLGNFVSVQVRGVDLASVGLVIALGGLSVADVLFLNLKERQAEFVTLETVGWEDRYLRRLVISEALAIGALGSLAGAVIGIAISSFIRGIPVTSIALAAVLAGGAGIAVAALASLVPLYSMRRLTPPTVLAEE
jgi:ABC-type antimicrobial peptide transport system permease subunit